MTDHRPVSTLVHTRMVGGGGQLGRFGGPGRPTLGLCAPCRRCRSVAQQSEPPRRGRPHRAAASAHGPARSRSVMAGRRALEPCPQDRPSGEDVDQAVCYIVCQDSRGRHRPSQTPLSEETAVTKRPALALTPRRQPAFARRTWALPSLKRGPNGAVIGDPRQIPCSDFWRAVQSRIQPRPVCWGRTRPPPPPDRHSATGTNRAASHANALHRINGPPADRAGRRRRAWRASARLYLLCYLRLRQWRRTLERCRPRTGSYYYTRRQTAQCGPLFTGAATGSRPVTAPCDWCYAGRLLPPVTGVMPAGYCPL